MGSINNYRVIKPLGEGAMANVYLVEDQQGRRFAIKELKEEHAADRNKRIRFHNEALIIKDYNHPNIIRVIEIAKKMQFRNNRGSYSNYAYVMEYCPGLSLKDYINSKPGKVLSPREINSLFSKILDALDYCHQKKVYHRDLKPANILLKKHGEKLAPVLTDFGVAKTFDVRITRGEDLTREVTLLGAPAYMSPEQITSPGDVTAKSDLYSIGIILYEAVTGERPFKGSRSEIIQQQLGSSPVPPTRLRNGIDAGLEKLILRLLEKNPSKRPTSAAEARQMLEQTTTELKKSATSVSTDTMFSRTVHISSIVQIDNGRPVRKMQFEKLPVIIGKTIINQPGGLREFFPVATNSQAILSKHAEILVTAEQKYYIREMSGQKLFVNTAVIRNDIYPLDPGKNRVRLPNGTWLEISVRKSAVANPVGYLILIVGIIIALVTVLKLIAG